MHAATYVTKVIWSQTSQLTQNSVDDYELLNSYGTEVLNARGPVKTHFRGLCMSSDVRTVLDGDGGSESNQWWNAVRNFMA